MESTDTVVPYDPSWPARFVLLRNTIDAALGGTIHTTEHVGSTAVPGLASKPVIDIDVVVADANDVDKAVIRLERAGYRHQGDLGIPGRQAFESPSHMPAHHLYVVVSGNRAHRDHVDLRDYLRRHPEKAARYGRAKESLAQHLSTNRPAYFAGKKPLIDQLLSAARECTT